MLQFIKTSPVLTASCAALLLFTVSSCKKDETSAETQAQLDKATLMLQANNSLVRSSVNTGQGNQEKASGVQDNTVDDRCGAVTAMPADLFTFPKILTFDYGTGCTDALGVDRAGSYTVNLQKIWEAGTTSSVQYADYSENGVVMNGSLAFSNTSTNTGLGFELVATNLKRKEVSGAETTVQSSLALKQTAGAITFWNWSDDVFEVTGTASYQLANGETGALTIVTPLVKANNCAWYNKGTATLVINGQTMDVDFGNGTCDNEATVTINGSSFVIKL